LSATLTVLGAGAILPRGLGPGDERRYGCAGYALRPGAEGSGGPVTLLDCGPGSVRALGPAGIALDDVRRVVLSHYHVDHCLDLLALAFARRNPAFAPAPPLERPRLERIGPRGLARIVDGAPAVFGAYAADPNAGTREVAPGETLEFEDMRLSSVATRHTPEALAWRVDLRGGASLLYTGDTGANPDVAALGRGVDLFLAECSFPDGASVEHHLTPSTAARLARDAGARELCLTHFYPGTDPEAARAVAARIFAGRIHVAHDGARIEVG
jgi:ribonuclease BN (tRNA processing enzyme)